MNGIEIAAESPFSDDARTLVALMTAEMAELYGRSGTGFFNPEDADGPRATFLIARIARHAVGCGALRPLSDDAAEIKRMFIMPFARGQGIARLLLEALERAAIEKDYSCVRLHTGTKQPVAISLYESAGYARIPLFGPYTDPETDLCFEKTLTQ